MGVTIEEIAHVAKLASLEMSPAELAEMHSHFEAILGHFARLGEIDTDGVAPTFHAVARVNVLREDTPLPPPDRDLLLSNAPATDGECYLVPLMMEDE